MDCAADDKNGSGDSDSSDADADGDADMDSDADGEGPVYDYAATVENTSIDCEVPTPPAAGTLTAIQKLPNPFVKMDGSTISKRSEWHCRREEIIRQAQAYVYGEKPMNPAVVSGTVTNNKITVHVEDNNKRIDFSANIRDPIRSCKLPLRITNRTFLTDVRKPICYTTSTYGVSWFSNMEFFQDAVEKPSKTRDSIFHNLHSCTYIVVRYRM